MNRIEVLISEVSEIKDNRKLRGRRYKLSNLLSIFILAVIAGADDFVAISTFASSKKDFLTRHGLIQKDRIPSHDTFRHILIHLEKSELSRLLSIWLQKAIDNIKFSDKKAISKDLLPKMIHIDGKSLRATRKGGEHTRSALQIVSAYCSNDSLTI